MALSVRLQTASHVVEGTGCPLSMPEDIVSSMTTLALTGMQHKSP